MDEPKPSNEFLKTYPRLQEWAHPMPAMMVSVAKSLWKFLHDTGHPQVKGTALDLPAFNTLEESTLHKMKAALCKIMLVDDQNQKHKSTAYTADMAILQPVEEHPSYEDLPHPAKRDEHEIHLMVEDGKKVGEKDEIWTAPAQQIYPSKQKDPFADLTAAFEKPREKCMTFNLKQILTKNGNVLMNMLERLLETTSISARDVETNQTLLEYACHIEHARAIIGDHIHQCQRCGDESNVARIRVSY